MVKLLLSLQEIRQRGKGDILAKNKTSISQASSYQEIEEFWAEHDLADFWEQTKPVEVEVEIKKQKRYYAIDRELSEKIEEFAKRRGITAETLINLWIYEKITEEKEIA